MARHRLRRAGTRPLQLHAFGQHLGAARVQGSRRPTARPVCRSQEPSPGPVWGSRTHRAGGGFKETRPGQPPVAPRLRGPARLPCPTLPLCPHHKRGEDSTARPRSPRASHAPHPPRRGWHWTAAGLSRRPRALPGAGHGAGTSVWHREGRRPGRGSWRQGPLWWAPRVKITCGYAQHDPRAEGHVTGLLCIRPIPAPVADRAGRLHQSRPVPRAVTCPAVTCPAATFTKVKVNSAAIP